MDFTVKINFLPCQHVVITFTSEKQTKNIVMTRDELKAELFDLDSEEAVKAILLNFVKEQLALDKTLPEIKTAIEGKVFKL